MCVCMYVWTCMHVQGHIYVPIYVQGHIHTYLQVASYVDLSITMF